MSLKANRFTQIIQQPLNVYNFVVDIPDVAEGLLVSSTTFPSEKLQTFSLYFQGEEIQYPCSPKNGGSWKIRVPESDSGAVKKVFDTFKRSMWNQKTGWLTPKKWKDITVTARDQSDNLVFSVVLHGAYCIGREGQDLDNSKNTTTWQWEYEFHYTWIEDIDLTNKGSEAPM